MPPTERVHTTWMHSDRYIPKRFVRPALEFMETETAGGVVLLVAAVFALVWANSPLWRSYASLWDAHLAIHVGSWFSFDETLKNVVNDGLMAIFFFVVGLEIKRELVVGELREPRKAALPVMAALGGMLVPALIYTTFILSSGATEAARGWGIPMATDIAFSVGVLVLLGSRVSLGAKLFLLALAIVDDLGAIIVIAIFYTSDLHLGWLAAGIAGLALIAIARKVGIRTYLFYGAVGVFVWFAIFASGVHATIAGVALGFLTPVHALYSDEKFRRNATWILQRFDMNATAPNARARLDEDALELAAVARESVSPLDRLERALHPWSSFLIIPLFALANAGVRFAGVDMGAAVTSPVTLGVGLGLLLGKPVGITIATWLAVRFRLGELPRNTDFKRIMSLGLLAGIGFTVSLFITELAFRGTPAAELFTDEAKLGIFIGSTLAGVIGFVVYRFVRSPGEGAAPLPEPGETVPAIAVD